MIDEIVSERVERQLDNVTYRASRFLAPTATVTTLSNASSSSQLHNR
jgi:hypothetical protein